MNFKDYIKTEPTPIKIDFNVDTHSLEGIIAYYKELERVVEEEKNDRHNIQNNK